MDSLLGIVLAAGIVANAVILGLLVLQAGRQARTGDVGSRSRSMARRPHAAPRPDGVSYGAIARRAGDSGVPTVPALPPTGSASVAEPRAARPDPRHPTENALARAIEAFVGSREADREAAAAPSFREPTPLAEAAPGPRRAGASTGTATSQPGPVRIRIVIERLDRIADRLGPAVAERVLDEVASGIAAASRSSDRVTRLAGATIEIGLDDTGAAAADRYAERARRLCDEWFEGSALGLRATVLPAAPEGDDAAGMG